MARPGLFASWLLDLAYLLVTPFLFMALLVASRGFTRPKLRRGLLSKLGVGLKPRVSAEPLLWLHAVSVGEVLTALPLIAAIETRWPRLQVLVSVSTYTGYEVASRRLGAARVMYAPLDFSLVVNRFYRRLRPIALLLIELELWPNLLLCARRRGIPVLVANGRLSARSAGRYAGLGRLTRALFRLPTAIGAQNEEYAERFRSVGVEPEKLSILGNLKHDRQPSPGVNQAPAVRARLGWIPEKTLVLVGGSTHPGEEKALLAFHARMRADEPRLRLVIVPRHVERLSETELAAWGSSVPLERWSVLRDAAGGQDPGVLVVDTLGELELFYALADLVFVGGSLIPHGGHNLLEPARLGKPIILGPSIENFRDERDRLLIANAAVQVADEAGFEAALVRLLGSADERARLGAAALEVTRRLGGAVHQHLQWLEAILRL